MKKIKTTPLIKLRIAAGNWATGLRMPASDSRDKAFRKLDRQLRQAAIAYARSW